MVPSTSTYFDLSLRWFGLEMEERPALERGSPGLGGDLPESHVSNEGRERGMAGVQKDGEGEGMTAAIAAKMAVVEKQTREMEICEMAMQRAALKEELKGGLDQQRAHEETVTVQLADLHAEMRMLGEARLLNEKLSAKASANDAAADDDVAAAAATTTTTTATTTTTTMEEDVVNECRVCRGEEEDADQPLVAPCLCSGSILLVHQECLQEWLAHSGKDTCELCNVKYRFESQYRDDMPEKLPLRDVVPSLVHLFTGTVLPMVGRLLLAVALWLVLVPVVTAWFFRLWMNSRDEDTSFLLHLPFLNDSVEDDIVHGIIIAGIVALSFLVLMSFTDFLRFNLHAHAHPQPPNVVPAAPAAPAAHVPAPVHVHVGPGAPDADTEAEAEGTRAGHAAVGPSSDASPLEPEGQTVLDLEPVPMPAAPAAVPMPAPVAAPAPDNDEAPVPAQVPALAPLAADNNNADNANMDDGMWEAWPEDDEMEDGEVHIAINELLGLHGPVTSLIRNILWLLAFNGAYIIVFAFLPYSLGSTIYSMVRTHAEGFMGYVATHLVPDEPGALVGAVQEVYAVYASKALGPQHSIVQLSHMAGVALGLQSMAFSILVFWDVVARAHKMAPQASLAAASGVLETSRVVIKVGVLLFFRIMYLQSASAS